MSRNHRLSIAADVSMGIGLVLVGAGVYFLVRERTEDPAAATLEAGIVPRVGGGSLSLRGAF